MKVCLEVLPSKLSKAMYRTAEGLANAAPPEVEIVGRPEDADLQILHVIGSGSLDHLGCDRYAAIQYCYKTTEWGDDPAAWSAFWSGADLVWSYYDLSADVPRETPFLLMPLGVSPKFSQNVLSEQYRSIGIMTSGFVSGLKAEAIEEVAIAADRVELSVQHVGPDTIEGMERPSGDWQSCTGIDDYQLRSLYERSRWVSGLRHVEGFELPVIEGLVNGARPIVFDRPETRLWFNGFAEFIPECSGGELVKKLSSVLWRQPRPVTEKERASALIKFGQDSISRTFWTSLAAASRIAQESRSRPDRENPLGSGDKTRQRPRSVRWLRGFGPERGLQMKTYDQLAELMRERYHTDRLMGISAADFEAKIRAMCGVEDHEIEGYEDPAKQRDQSVKFTWGHDQDFGTFKVSGLMRDRHIRIVADFIDRTGAIGLDLSGLRVLDVGCWTGGMSLLLAAMGAEVTAVEEVQKYANATEFLATSFGLTLRVIGSSLYDLGLKPDFDIVIISGVLYHVSDPILALRIMFNCTKDGGVCLIETEVDPSDKPVARYAGPSRARGNAEDRTRQGWNWWVPSVPAFQQMLMDVGFLTVHRFLGPAARALFVAKRGAHFDMLRAGLSNREVR